MTSLDDRLAAVIAQHEANRSLFDDVNWQTLSSTQLECSFLRALLSSSSSSTSDTSSHVRVFDNLLLSWTSLNDVTDPKSRELGSTIPLLLLENVLSTCPLSQWPFILSIVEQHRKVIRDLCFPRARVSLLILSNDVFRRASPLRYASIRGRFHLLLSYFLASPFDRAIVPGETCLITAPTDFGSPVDAGYDSKEDEEGEVVSASAKNRLIEAFWKLQSVYFQGKFSSITQAQLSDFTALLGEMTTAFDKNPATREGVLTPAVFSLPMSCATHARFSQLVRSRSFRRVVLVQALLFLSMLNKSEELGASIAREELRIHRLLEQFDGTSSTVVSAVAHEADWNSLKDESRKDNSSKRADNSSELFLPPADIETLLSTKRQRTRSSSSASSSSASSFDPEDDRQYGNAALTKLWSADYEPVTDPSRQYQPSLTEFLTPLVEQLNPCAGIEPEYLLSNDEVFAWRGLRFMLRENVSLFCRKSVLPRFQDAVMEFFPEHKLAYDPQTEQEQQVALDQEESKEEVQDDQADEFDENNLIMSADEF